MFSADEMKPVSVMKGDSEVQRDDIIDWMNEDYDEHIIYIVNYWCILNTVILCFFFFTNNIF